MTLGDILQQAATKDLAHNGKKGINYTELIDDNKFKIKLSSTVYPEAYIECAIPVETATEEEKNYARLYILSMIFNAAIYGTKRMNYKKSKKK